MDEHLGEKQPPTRCLTNTKLNLEQLPSQGCFDLVTGGDGAFDDDDG